MDSKVIEQKAIEYINACNYQNAGYPKKYSSELYDAFIAGATLMSDELSKANARVLELETELGTYAGLQEGFRYSQQGIHKLSKKNEKQQAKIVELEAVVSSQAKEKEEHGAILNRYSDKFAELRAENEKLKKDLEANENLAKWHKETSVDLQQRLDTSSEKLKEAVEIIKIGSFGCPPNCDSGCSPLCEIKGSEKRVNEFLEANPLNTSQVERWTQEEIDEGIKEGDRLYKLLGEPSQVESKSCGSNTDKKQNTVSLKTLPDKYSYCPNFGEIDNEDEEEDFRE